MSKIGRPPKDRTPAIEDLPKAFRLAFISVMSKFGIADVSEGFRRAAILLNVGSAQYQKDVNKEAERRYRSRHFTEMNKTRKTWEKAAFERGHHSGYREAERIYTITYPCSICGGLITIMPNSDSHKATQRYLREQGWAHNTCINR